MVLVLHLFITVCQLLSLHCICEKPRERNQQAGDKYQLFGSRVVGLKISLCGRVNIYLYYMWADYTVLYTPATSPRCGNSM
jgi:hypothetical protein